MKRLEKSIALILAVSVIGVSTLMVGCGKKQQGASSQSTVPATGNSTAQSSLVSDKKVNFTWMVSEHPNRPVKEDWPVLKFLEEKTNVKITLQPVPDANYNEKRKLLLASNEIPDIMTGKLDEANTFGQQGAFLAWNDYIEKYGDNIKKNLGKDTINSLKDINGNIYALPTMVDADIVLAWLIRKDVVDKNNIKIGDTPDTFYNTLKQLKAAYPDSYPIANRYNTVTNNIFWSFSGVWGIGQNLYFDNASKTFKYGELQPEFKELVKYLNKLYAEKLLDPEYAMTSTKQWEEKMSNGKSFVTVDNYGRGDVFTDLMSKENKDYNLVAMVPPKVGSGKPKIIGNNKQYAFTVFSAKVKEPVVLAKFINYLYGEEGQTLYNWGIEGQTFKMENGKKTVMDTVINSNTGKGTIELWRDLGVGPYFPTIERTVEMGNEYKYGKNTKNAVDLYAKNVEYMPVLPNIAFTKEENDIVRPLKSAVDDYIIKNLDKFVMKGYDEAEFNNFVAKLKELGAEKILDYHNKAYQKQYK